ncbi:MAG: glycosyltransferase family 2 protein [Solobacterium sp.]|nr:glycosyltransferase family 2 protein [Solobacterium sp.]
MRLSLIIPCFNEEEVLPDFFRETEEVRSELFTRFAVQLEYIFVDDGSKDGTLACLRRLSAEHDYVRYISFARNFGKEAAIAAGLQAAEGDYVGLIDADLQDPPALMAEMMEMILAGKCDAAAAYRKDRRGESRLRSWCANRFYRLLSSAGEKMPQGARDYRIMTKQVRDALMQMQEYNRFSRAMFQWVGFRTEWIGYENRTRAAGRTKWSLSGLMRYAVDALTGYSSSPLRIASWFGIGMFFLSVVGIIFVIVRKLLFGDPTSGWPSLVCIILFCSGIQLFCIGIIGEYLARTYMEVKDRPLYIIRETDRTQKKE